MHKNFIFSHFLPLFPLRCFYFISSIESSLVVHLWKCQWNEEKINNWSWKFIPSHYYWLLTVLYFIWKKEKHLILMNHVQNCIVLYILLIVVDRKLYFILFHLYLYVVKCVCCFLFFYLLLSFPSCLRRMMINFSTHCWSFAIRNTRL